MFLSEPLGETSILILPSATLAMSRAILMYVPVSEPAVRPMTSLAPRVGVQIDDCPQDNREKDQVSHLALPTSGLAIARAPARKNRLTVTRRAQCRLAL